MLWNGGGQVLMPCNTIKCGPNASPLVCDGIEDLMDVPSPNEAPMCHCRNSG